MACRQSHQGTRTSVLLVLAFAARGAAWDYSLNGANWDGLGQCGSGGQQSPVNLPTVAEVAEQQKLFLKYPEIDSSFQLYNNGYSIAFTLPESYKGGFGLSAALDDLNSKDAEAFRLWQVNFHSPSEHTLNGERMPLEMQMMHQRVTGGSPETAVVVVFFQHAANSYLDVLDKLMQEGLPKKAWEEKPVASGIKLADIVGGSPFYSYEGSLTVPPCESQVKYYVRQEPIPTAHAQIRRFQKVLEQTCAPKGNYRLVRPLTGKLTLMASVDVIKDPSRTVKPKISKVEGEAKAAAGEDFVKPMGKAWDCPVSYYDAQSHNIGRIQVGDSPEYIAAKERFNRNKRELQVAEGSEANAYRAYKFQQGLYDTAPGFAEKINTKWALTGALAVYEGAKKSLGALAGSAGAEKEKIGEAIYKECYRIFHQGKEDGVEKGVIVEEPAPAEAAAPAKFNYPEPHVSLPHGLDASPFADKGEDATATEAGDADANLVRISPNLHQPEMPPSASVEEAQGTKAGNVKNEEPAQEVILSMDLPVAPDALVDKAAFEKDLVNALASSAKMSPSRMEVKELKGHAVAKVHGSLSFAQQTLTGSVKTKFLRPTPLH